MAYQGHGQGGGQGYNQNSGYPQAAWQQQQQQQQQSGAEGQSGGSIVSQVSLPFIDHNDLVGYENYFKQAGPSASGQLAATAARSFLLQSGLPNEVLARIWTLCASSTPTSLTFAEFCLAMHLAKLARGGTMPPHQLPETVAQQLSASNANLGRMNQQISPGQQQPLLGGQQAYNALSALPSHLTNNPGPVSVHSTGGSSYGSAGYMTPQSTGMSSPAYGQNIAYRAPSLAQQSGGSSRTSSFHGVPSGVTVLDGFAGPLVAQASQQPSNGNRNWAIDATEKAQYDSIFKVWDPQNSGYISGDRARNIFTQSGLPDGILGHIWHLADMQKHGKLNADEFAVAMHLVYQKLNGKDLPQTLPSNLIPPSTRELDSLTNLAKTQIMSDIVNKKSNSRRNSPAGSMPNLFGVADPLGGFASTSPNLNERRKLQMQRDAEETSRKLIAAQVEEKRRELAQVKEATAIANKTATQHQMDIDRLKREARQFHEDSQRAKGPTSGAVSGGSARVNVTDRAEKIDGEIRVLLQNCRQLVNSYADKKLERARSAAGTAEGGPGANPSGPDALQNKAAALLAARMAALGVSAPTAAPAGPSGNAPRAPSIAQIEEEKARKLKDIDAAADRTRIIVGKIRDSAGKASLHSASPTRGWEPPMQEKLKFEQGVGIRSKDVRSFLDELAKGAFPSSTRSSYSGESRPSNVDSSEPSRDYTSAASPRVSSPPVPSPFDSTPSAATSSLPESTPQISKLTPLSTTRPPAPPIPPPLASSNAPRAFDFFSPAQIVPSRQLASNGATSPLKSPQSTSQPGTINDVVAQAEAAIRAVRDRQAAKLAGASLPSTPSSVDTKNPFATSAAPATGRGQPSSPNTSVPEPFPTPKQDEEEDEVDRAMRRMKEQEAEVFGADFRSGAGNVGVAVPVPRKSSIGAGVNAALSGPRGQPAPSVPYKSGAPSAMEKIRQREQEVLAEQKRIRDEQEKRSRASPPSVPRRVSGLDRFKSPASPIVTNPSQNSATSTPVSPPPPPVALSSSALVTNLASPNGIPPPPPPPPPLPGSASFVRPPSALKPQASSSATNPAKKLNPVDVGARKASLVVSGGPVQSVGNVSSRIKNLQGGMAHIFGTPVDISHSDRIGPVSPLPTSSISSGPDSDWEIVEESRERADHMAALPSARSAHGGPFTGTAPTTGTVTSASRAIKTLSDVFSDKFAAGLSAMTEGKRRVNTGRSQVELLTCLNVVVANQTSSDPTPNPTIVTSAAENDFMYKSRAQFVYEPAGSDDLRLDIGDVIEVEREEGDWLYGRHLGQSGWFPRTYVEKIEDGLVPPSDPPMRAPTPSMLDARALSTASALWDYETQHPDEVSMRVGETVSVLEKTDAEWWKVENARGETGLVPVTYLEERPVISNKGSPTAKSPSAIPPWMTSLGGGGNSGSNSAVSSAQSSFYEPGSGAMAGYATPPLPLKTKQYMLPQSGSFTIQSLGVHDDDGEIHSAQHSRKGSYDDLDMDSQTQNKGMTKSTSFSIQPGQVSTAWATKVDPQRLQSIPLDERKRQEAIYELITTEQSYVRDLESICHIFYSAMGSLMSPTDLASIFCNIEDIKMVNAVILSDFEAIQAEQDYIIDAIGEMFCRHASSLSVYEIYCGNFGNALKLLQKLRGENPRLAEFLKHEQRNNRLCRSLDLSSFLLQPMQRITRYSLLLKQVLHFTPKMHPDHEPVVRALAMAEREAELVNSAARERESREKLIEVSQVLDLTCDEVII
ncbi:hypothetical protein HKX48_006390 [Thoreauomyces humboldtii]|nr:hypothetical protein HKX48_006390 [Thoreauomyces humboldtii]